MAWIRREIRCLLFQIVERLDDRKLGNILTFCIDDLLRRYTPINQLEYE